MPLFTARYFCVSRRGSSHTSYSCPIKIYILSDVCVLIFIVNSCIPRHLPGGGGHCDLDIVDLLAVTVLKVHGQSILKPWSGERIFPYGSGHKLCAGLGKLGPVGDVLGIVSTVIVAIVSTVIYSPFLSFDLSSREL